MQITTKTDLDLAIIQLEKKKLLQEADLKSQFQETVEGLKPSNIIKRTFARITEPGDVRNTILKAAGGIGAGLLTKGIITGKTSSILGSVVGNILKVSATTAFYKNADKLNAYGTAIYNNLFKKKTKQVDLRS